MNCKKNLVLLVVFLSVFLAAVGCGNKQVTINQALANSKIKVAKIYHVEEYGDKALAFYKKENKDALQIGIFYQKQDGWHFILEDSLIPPEDVNKDMSHTIFMQPKTEEISQFSLVYGIINNPQIEKVRLKMTSGEIEDRYAKVAEIKGQKVWYDLYHGKEIFNIQQGLSSDDQIIYDPGKAG